ncbi:MAG: carboxypeptidase-like regulatory domain-containing protein, partial [Candidatus Nanohaloarchaea archaeon]
VDYTGENTKVRLKMDTDLISSDSRRVDINFSVPYMESQGRGFWLSDEVQNLELNRWKIEDLKVRPGEVLSAQSVSELSITADILYEGEPVNQREDLSSGDFYIRRPGQDGYQSFSAELVKPEEGRYRLDLNGRIPNLDGVGSHRLEVVFRSNLSSSGPVKVTDLRVEKKFEFTGKVSNSNRRVVDTSFTLTPENGDYTHRFSTDASGEFSRRILPGKWDFSVDFPKAELNLENVKLDPSYIGNDPDERPNINYDYFKQPGSMDMELEGVKPINMLAISFGYPFKSASVKMDYNPAKAEDPMEVQVFECTNWNFWARSCIGNWEKIPEEEIMRKPTEWWAKFPVDPVQTSEFGGTENVMLNAYVIGTNSDLVVNQLQWNDARVPVGEDFTVEGIVQSGSGAAVQGANVTFSLMKNGGVVKSKTVQSGSDGRFS